MDYKYIEQLIERYFQCETTLQEEHILSAFFAQEEQEVPQQLRQYRPLFAAMQPHDSLGDDFDQRILALTEEPLVVKARTISLRERLQPLFRAAATVAIVLTLGNAMNITFQHERTQTDDINYAAYKDTCRGLRQDGGRTTAHLRRVQPRTAGRLGETRFTQC